MRGRLHFNNTLDCASTTIDNDLEVSHECFRIIIEASTEEEQESYPQLSPDFVIELRSKSDRLNALKEKMLDYAMNGVRLGWLIDPFEKQVHIYRADESTEIIESPLSIEGEDVLPGFVLNLTPIWN